MAMKDGCLISQPDPSGAVNLLAALFFPSNANWIFHKLFGNFP
jgi:hypothetical protein